MRGVIILLLALNQRKKIVKANKILRKEDFYYCPACKHRVYLKTGQVISPHFAHYKKENCAVFSEGETQEHLKGKLALANYFKIYGGQIQLEAYLPKLKQRPDILIKKGKKKVAIEFQCSPISIENIKERTNGYIKEDYDIIWILGNNFKYKKSLTALQKACLYLSKKNNRLILFHYEVEQEELILSYDYQLNHHAKMIRRSKKVKTNAKNKIYLEKHHQVLAVNSDFTKMKEKQKRFMGMVRYPSDVLLSFLALIYKKDENIITLPKEIFQTLPSEWLVKTYHLTWKYRFVLWIENHFVQEIITKKSIKKWLKKEIQKEEFIFHKIPNLDEELMLKVIVEFITLLLARNILRKKSEEKWVYQQPLKRYKNLEEKFK